MNAARRPEARREVAGRWAAVFVTALLTATGVFCGAGPAAAASPTPGAVLSSTTTTLPPELVPLGTGKKITYASTNAAGGAITVSGLVITPKGTKRNQVVAWAHGTTGVAPQCAPSINMNVFWPEARAAVAALLTKGFTVAASDYPGLGTPQPHQYLIGASEARAIIDSVKAARNLDSSLKAQYSLDGHSQGGQGSLWAGQIAPSYDGNLVLKAVSAIAPVSNEETLATYIPASPGQGYLPMALSGLSAAKNTTQPFTVLQPPAQQKLPVLATGCLNEIIAAYAPLTSGQMVAGNIVPSSILNDLKKYGNPAQSAQSSPILITQGSADESVPQFITDLLIPQLKHYDSRVEYRVLTGATHDSAVTLSATDVANWIAGKMPV